MRLLSSLVASLLLVPVAASAQGQTSVTFTKDVAPILQRSCVTCHRPGEMAPMSLMTYEDVRPWARAIKTRTSAREMPPWHIDRTIGIQDFKNNPSLSDQEIATIAKWVDAGAPRGNPADLAPLRQFAGDSEWQLHARHRHQVPDRIRSCLRVPTFTATSTPTSRSIPIATSRRSRRAPRTRSHARSFITRCRMPWTAPIKTRPATTARAWTAASSSSSTRRARTPRCIRTIPASTSSRARRRWSAITSTRSAKK